MTDVRRAVGAGALLVALAACGSADSGSGAPGPSAPPVTPSALDVATPPPAPGGDELPVLPPPVREGPVLTLTGTLVAGVEQGCLVLQAADADYLLVGGDRSVLRPGARVTVRGRADSSLVTTCQQGTAFAVASASPG